MYRQYAEQLLDKGHAYYAFDTSEELDQMREQMKKLEFPSPSVQCRCQRQYAKLFFSEDEVADRLQRGEPYVIRAKMPRNEEVRIPDAIRGLVAINTNNLDDKVLFKSDGMPTYHLHVVDDHLMNITYGSWRRMVAVKAPLHVLLYQFFGWDTPTFAHLPLILKPDGNGKLSKRDGDRLGFPVFPIEWNNPQSKEVSSGYREGVFCGGIY